jgi:hypothetical protein
MKKLIVAAAFALSSTSAFAFNMPNLTFPTESGWAVAMTAMACGVDMSVEDGYEGRIIQHDGFVVYTVSKDGVPVLGASAKNTKIWAKKTCLDG